LLLRHRPNFTTFWDAWSSNQVVARGAEFAVIGACALLCLHAAGTIELVYTIRISYALVAVACVVALPLVVQGWRRLPSTVAVPALLLLVAYVTAALVGDHAVLPSQGRGSGYRDLVYLADLTVGLASVGLVAGLWSVAEDLRPAVLAILGGAVVAALYGLYQWPAQHFGWPLSDINSARNPDAFTYGAVFEGTGIFGWERIRGPFTEPLFEALFLTMALPLTLALGKPSNLRKWGTTIAIVGALIAATLLTSSSLAWTIFALAALGASSVYAVATGRIGMARALGAALALAAATASGLFFDPALLAQATGRTPEQLQATVSSRRSAWNEAEQVWSTRPLIGFGPGQSGVKLAHRPDPAASGVAHAPVVLGSANGVWAAALVDAGLVGLTLWLALMGTILALAVRGVLAAPNLLRVGLLCAAAVGVGASLVTGDRVELRVWIVLGLVLVATTRGSTEPKTS
jgi:hypothetical protein